MTDRICEHCDLGTVRRGHCGYCERPAKGVPDQRETLPAPPECACGGDAPADWEHQPAACISPCGIHFRLPPTTARVPTDPDAPSVTFNRPTVPGPTATHPSGSSAGCAHCGVSMPGVHAHDCVTLTAGPCGLRAGQLVTRGADGKAYPANPTPEQRRTTLVSALADAVEGHAESDRRELWEAVRDELGRREKARNPLITVVVDSPEDQREEQYADFAMAVGRALGTAGYHYTVSESGEITHEEREPKK